LCIFFKTKGCLQTLSPKIKYKEPELGAGRLEEETAGASRKLIASKDDGVDSR